MSDQAKQPKNFFLIAGEHSGDALGAKLIEALKARSHPGELTLNGLGGELMEKEGLKPLFPLEEVAIMGPTAILARLPQLVRRVYQCVDSVLAAKPDALIIIDSPEFTHPIAKRVRRKAPHIPIINYVSPTVWAWRPGRARKMKPYVDEVLALLPFEPAYHEALGGPSCHYVGHPLIEKKQWIDALDLESFRVKYNLTEGRKSLLLLPGSRPNEIKHLMQPFKEAAMGLMEKTGPLDLLLPTVASQQKVIEAAIQSWPQKPIIITGEEDKYAAFRQGSAALAASGTVSLELALTQTPMVVTYKFDKYLIILKPLMKARYFALANHIYGDKVFPELIQENCTPENIINELAPLFDETSENYRDQQKHLTQTLNNMVLDGQTPSERAADITLKTIRKKAQQVS